MQEAQRTVNEYIAAEGLTVEHTDDCPETTAEITPPWTSTARTVVSAPTGEVVFAITTRTFWGRGDGRQDGHRIEDGIDEWEDKQTDVQGTSCELEGVIPASILDAAEAWRDGMGARRAVDLLCRGRMAAVAQRGVTSDAPAPQAAD